jgi:hypothetical protein
MLNDVSASRKEKEIFGFIFGEPKHFLNEMAGRGIPGMATK